MSGAGRVAARFAPRPSPLESFMIALEAINVTKVYGTGANAVTAVNDVSLSVKRGEFID